MEVVAVRVHEVTSDAQKYTADFLNYKQSNLRTHTHRTAGQVDGSPTWPLELPGGSGKTQTPESLNQKIGVGPEESACLTCSQVMLMLLVSELLSENRWMKWRKTARFQGMEVFLRAQ